MRTEQLVRVGVLIGMTAAAAGSGGCSTMNNTEKGAGIGAALGTGAGLALGAATGNPRTGAVVGGLLGTGVGAAVGNDADRADQARRDANQVAVATAQAQAVAQQSRLGMTDVIHMAQQGMDDTVIINQIHNTGSTFQLSVSDLETLKANSVSPAVISAMQNARAPVVMAPQPVVVRPPGVIYAAPAPPPVVVVGGPRYYGGYYHRRYWW
jgi:hypothetical protein